MKPKTKKHIPLDGLKIGYDGKRAVANYTGIGNYSRCLVDAMSLLYPKCEYILYSPKFKDNPLLNPIIDRKNVELKVPAKFWRTFGSLWRSVEVTRQLIEDDVTLYHGLSNELPLNIDRSGIPSVVTIHDLIWRKIPQNYSVVDRNIYDWKYKVSAERATRIIAISERTKQDLIEEFDIDPAKIDVVYQCCDPAFLQPLQSETAKSIRETYNLPERYILAVGTVEYRKNQLLAVEALRALPSDVKLVIVGRRSKDYAREIDSVITRNHLSDRVIWLSNVSNSHLPYLYKQARISSYTSRYEGFGLPIVESLNVGTPVIAATGSCLEEAGGKGCIYVHPDNVDEYIEAATRLLDDNYYYHKYADNGKAHVKKFSLMEFSRQTMTTYTKALFDINI